MKSEIGLMKAAKPNDKIVGENRLHPAWRAFIQYCFRLQHGEIQVLKIQDGVPVLAELTKKKVKFVP